MRKSLLFVALAGLAGSAVAGPSPQNANFNVTANIAGSCVVSAADIAFGAYDPVDVNASTPKDASGTVTVRCTKGMSTAVAALNQGANPTGTSSCAAPDRQMNGGGALRLGYGIYQDAARTTTWGCDAANDLALPAFTSSITPQVLTTYGRIPAGQDASIGSYTDTVQVSVTF
jgi:spore coat protein U-like protein